MKNIRVNFIAVMICLSLCLTAAAPQKARGCAPDEPEKPWDQWVDPEDISYIVDFLDYDGNFLDSRICSYGQKLEDIKIPEREEDEEYTYRFTGWEPELCQVVTESAAYIAVYEKIPKDGSDPEAPEISSNSQEKAAPENPLPQGPDQIYAISYEVVPIHVETPVPEPTPEPAPVITPETPKLHGGRIHNMTVPVIHTSKVVREKTAETVNEPPQETSQEALDEGNHNTPQTAGTTEDNNRAPDGEQEQPGIGTDQKKGEKKETTGNFETAPDREDTAEQNTEARGRKEAESKGTGRGSEAGTDGYGKILEEQPEAYQASFGRRAHTKEAGIPVYLLVAGMLGGGLYIWYREKHRGK